MNGQPTFNPQTWPEIITSHDATSAFLKFRDVMQCEHFFLSHSDRKNIASRHGCFLLIGANVKRKVAKTKTCGVLTPFRPL